MSIFTEKTSALLAFESLFYNGEYVDRSIFLRMVRGGVQFRFTRCAKVKFRR